MGQEFSYFLSKTCIGPSNLDISGDRELPALSGAGSPCPAYCVEVSWLQVALAASLSAVAKY